MVQHEPERCHVGRLRHPGTRKPAQPGFAGDAPVVEFQQAYQQAGKCRLHCQTGVGQHCEHGALCCLFEHKQCSPKLVGSICSILFGWTKMLNCSTLALCLAGAAASAGALAQNWVAQPSGTTASLRGISAVSPEVVWASGAGGTYLRTEDGGASWHAAVVPGAQELDFRGVYAFNSRVAWLMSSGPGVKSRIYKTADGGAHWSLRYTNPDASGFFDALAFWDARRGVVLGDPVDGQFVILTTEDGGQTWRRHTLPPALPNEGAFAASNSCLVVRAGREVWFGTGGPSGARVFQCRARGEH